MGEAVGIKGTFKAEKGRQKEIKKVLIAELSEFLRPNYYPVRWDDYFNENDDILSVEFETFGSYGFAEDYIEKKFVKEYPDVIVEFSVEVYDSGEITTIFSNGGKVNVICERIEGDDYEYDDWYHTGYFGRFKTDKKRYTAIRDTLIKKLSKLDIRPEELVDPFVVKDWKQLFYKEDEYLEMLIHGFNENVSESVIKYMENNFIEEHKDVLFEFAIVEYNDPAIVKRIIYNGEKVEVKENFVSEELKSNNIELYDEEDYEYEYCFIK